MEQKIINIRGKIEYAEKITSEKLQIPEEFKKEQELTFMLQELEELKGHKINYDSIMLAKQLQKLQMDELDLITEINKLNMELKEGKTVYQELLAKKDACCPTCKQKLNNESKDNATSKLRNNIMNVYDKQNKLKEKQQKMHADILMTKGKIYSAEHTTDEVSPETIKNLEKNIHILTQEKQENIKIHNEYNAKLQTIQNAQKDIETFKKEIEGLNKAIEETKKQVEVAKQLYFNSIKAKMDLADKYLKDVKIRFYKVVKATGEIKDDFVITYKDKDFSVLSRSEKVAAALEIANMFNKVTKLNSPLFIDDSESYPDFDFTNIYGDTQIFMAQVKKGKNLKITSNEKEEISGYKSDKNYTKKSKEKQQEVAVA